MLITGEESSNIHRDRKAIRDRVIAGMFDLNLLSHYWPQKEMDKVFPPLNLNPIAEYYYGSVDYTKSDLEDFLGKGYTEEDRRVQLGPDYVQLDTSSRGYLYGLNTFLLRVIRANPSGGKIQNPRDLIAPELQEFERLIEDGVTQHLAQSHQHHCEVDVSIDLFGCTKLEDGD